MKFLKSLTKSLEQITENLIKIHLDMKSLNHNIEEGKLSNVLYDKDNQLLTCKVDSIDGYIKSNVPTFRNTEDMIKKQILFDKDYTKRYEENPALIKLIETYVKHDDEYEIIDLYDRLNSKFDISFKNETKKQK